MEKSVPHYVLADILRQMATVDAMYLTFSALDGIRSAGLTRADALLIVRSLQRKNFYKSMTTHANHQVWQDVYHGTHGELALYIKFQRASAYFVVSFKEL